MKFINTVSQINGFKFFSVLGYIIPAIMLIGLLIILAIMKTASGYEAAFNSLFLIVYYIDAFFYIGIFDLAVFIGGGIEYLVRRNKIDETFICKRPYFFTIGLIINIIILILFVILLFRFYYYTHF